MGGRLTRLDFVFFRLSCLDICVFSNRLDSLSAVRQTDVKTFFFAGLFVMTNTGRQLFQQAGNISPQNSIKMFKLTTYGGTFCCTMANCFTF